MEVFIRDEDKKWYISYSLADKNNSLDCKDHKQIIVKSLDQHDAEIRKPLEDEIERLGRLCDKLNKDYLEQKEISAYGMKELNNTIRQLKQAKQEVIDELLEWLVKNYNEFVYDEYSDVYTSCITQNNLEEKLTELKGE